MKIYQLAPLFIATTLFFLPAPPAAAQDTESLTNDTPTLKQLMTTNSVVTNSVGLVFVKISQGLWAGKFETTQDGYQKIMHRNPSAFSGTQKPVDSVSWNDAMAFCQQLTTKEKAGLPEGFNYTLPTQDQWLMLMSDASLSDAVMKLQGNYSSTANVGSLGANNLGLYDTRGNVMEWTLDPQDKPYRVLKGGAWDTFLPVNARPEFHWYAKPDEAKNSYGFRVILTSSSNPAPTSSNPGSY